MGKVCSVQVMEGVPYVNQCIQRTHLTIVSVIESKEKPVDLVLWDTTNISQPHLQFVSVQTAIPILVHHATSTATHSQLALYDLIRFT